MVRTKTRLRQGMTNMSTSSKKRSRSRLRQSRRFKKKESSRCSPYASGYRGKHAKTYRRPQRKVRGGAQHPHHAVKKALASGLLLGIIKSDGIYIGCPFTKCQTFKKKRYYSIRDSDFALMSSSDFDKITQFKCKGRITRVKYQKGTPNITIQVVRDIFNLRADSAEHAQAWYSMAMSSCSNFYDEPIQFLQAEVSYGFPATESPNSYDVFNDDGESSDDEQYSDDE